MRRMTVAGLAAGLAFLVLAVSLAVTPDAGPPDNRPNILVVLTDDQTLDTLPSDPPAMPWFQAQLEDPGGHWLWFPNAVASTPLCCPSRATILTGQTELGTQVRNNDQGWRLDDTNTLPVWLDESGYHTGLVGKYLNFYPWGRVPFIPPGWDRWFAKMSGDESTAYYDYAAVDQTTPRYFGSRPQDYATDVLGAQALRFVQEAPAGQPWFLYFSPNAPHLPWVPAHRYTGAFAEVDPPIPPLDVLNDVTGKPPYVRRYPPLTESDRLGYIAADRNERAMLLSVDDWFREIVEAVEARGELDNTVIVFLTDNGYTLGLHRLEGKRFPYAPSIQVPFAIRSPWTDAGTVRDVVSNLDLAGTIAGIAGIEPGLPQDGIDLGPALHGEPLPDRAGVYLRWSGDANVPPWQGVRTERYVFIRNADGTEELYAVTDRYQLYNLVGEPEHAGVLAGLRALLMAVAARAQG